MVVSRKRATAERLEGAPRPRAATDRRARSRRRFERRMLPWLLLVPALVLILGLFLYPVARTFQLSVTSADLGTLLGAPAEYVGLDNFRNVFTQSEYSAMVVRTVVFGLACVVATMVLGFAVAMFLNQRFRGRKLVAALVVLPWAVPPVANGTVWDWMFNDQFGIVNWALDSVLSPLGIHTFDGFAWFTEPVLAFTAIGVVVVWYSFPFVALSILAGLQTIPADVLDAARVDGASTWQRLRHVVIPLLRPLLAVLIVISTIWDFKVFDQIFVMTGGGPSRETEVLAIGTWREAFALSHFGQAAALSVVLFLILVVVTIIYIKLIHRDQVQEA